MKARFLLNFSTCRLLEFLTLDKARSRSDRMNFDTIEINRRLPDYLTAIAWTPSRTTEMSMAGPCPIHGGVKPNFQCDLQPDRTWLWICRSGCGGLGGDCLTFHGEWTGISPKSKEFIPTAAGVVRLEGSTTYQPKTRARKLLPKPAPKPLNLPDDFEQLHQRARGLVYESEEIQNLLSEEFGVSPATIKSLTFTADALGWSSKHGRPLYLYETGVKLRNLSTIKPRFQWLTGRPVKPWRAHLMERPQVQRVFLCEGESDAIALLDSGVENLHPEDGEIGTTVIAIPGTSFKEEWAEIFAGMDLIICTDNDLAGNKAFERITKLCSPFTKSISRFHLTT